VLDILLLYLGIGVASIPLACYSLYTADETDRRGDPLIFWIAMLTVCIATVFLWPVISYLILNHLVLEWRSKPKQLNDSDWTAIAERWKKVTCLSKQLDDALNGFLDSDELDWEAEKRIRLLFAEIDREYDRWSSLEKKLSTFRAMLPDDEKVLRILAYLKEDPSWPRLKVAIRVEYDPLTNGRRLSHSTVRFLFPEEPQENPSDTEQHGKVSASFKVQQSTLIEVEIHPWNFTLSARFKGAIKKLRGIEKEKVESALADIILSPTTARGNTKTSLSNNRRDFWRYRLGDCRIIYSVDNQAKTVTMIDYTHRSKAYH
jgi:mRNA-degrading endonuclease RelE of RelBE toxin-antitoxin system